MADETKNPQEEAKAETAKKVDLPTGVTAGQAVGYDPAQYASRTDRHQELLQRFGISTYPAFEDKLGTQFARAVVAYLLGDAEHARVLGSVLITDPQQAVPGGVKAADGEAENADPDKSYETAGQKVAVANGSYFVNGFKFAEKQKADLYAGSLNNKQTEDAGDPVAKPADGAEKTALGADGEIGGADLVAQAQKDKDFSGVTEQQNQQADAAK